MVTVASLTGSSETKNEFAADFERDSYVQTTEETRIVSPISITVLEVPVRCRVRRHGPHRPHTGLAASHSCAAYSCGRAENPTEPLSEWTDAVSERDPAAAGEAQRRGVGA